MRPQASWPSTTGGGIGMVPLEAERSLWQTPMASIWIITCWAFGESTSISSISTGFAQSRATTAFDFFAMTSSSSDLAPGGAQCTRGPPRVPKHASRGCV